MEDILHALDWNVPDSTSSGDQNPPPKSQSAPKEKKRGRKKQNAASSNSGSLAKTHGITDEDFLQTILSDLEH